MNWSSEALHLNPYTCIDVKADEAGVTLGQVDAVSLHNIHLTPDQCRTLACYLIDGAEHAEVAA